jgi:hypothetical protein
VLIFRAFIFPWLLFKACEAPPLTSELMVDDKKPTINHQYGVLREQQEYQEFYD